MLKEQKEQDAVLNRIGQLLHDLKTHNTTAAISIFQLPPDTPTKGSAKWGKDGDGGGTPAYFETEEPPYCVGPYKLGNREPPKDHLAGVQYWIRVDDAMSITSGGVLSVLALILLPQEINPREQKVASRFLDMVLEQKHKNRKSKKTKKSDNWSRFLRLRGAWNDQDDARGWVDDQNMLDFSWNDVKNPTRFGVDFGQSMEPDQVRKEQREAKYWWIDIPDLTGLVLKILPTLERQREKELRGGKSKKKLVGEGNVIDHSQGTLSDTESISSTALRHNVSRGTAKKGREEESGKLNHYQSPQGQSVSPNREAGGDALKYVTAIDKQESQGTLEELKDSMVMYIRNEWGWKKAKAEQWVAQYNNTHELNDALEEVNQKNINAHVTDTWDEERL